MGANQLAELMLKQVWKLHGLPDTVVSYQGSIFIFCVVQEIDKHLGICLHPYTYYHLRIDGESELTNKAVEQYLRHLN